MFGPLHVGPEGAEAEGCLPGALWKDCERMRGRADEVASAPKMSPLGHGGEPRTPALGLARPKSETKTNTHTCMH